MAAKAASMGRYKSTNRPERWHLVRKVSLLLLLVVAAVLGLAIMSERDDGLPKALFNVLADGSIGILMGFGTRLVLRQRHWLIRAVVSASLSIVGLVLLGLLTDAKNGIGPFELQIARVDWLESAGLGLKAPLLPGGNSTDLLDASHLVIAVTLSWISLRAWHKGGQSSEMRLGAPTLAKTTGASVPIRRLRKQPAPPIIRRLPGRARTRPIAQPKMIGRSIPKGGTALRPARPRSRTRTVFRRRRGVQLGAHEEHRCPYCLEHVRRADARGSVACPVCHTLHHKDCWDITGACQVPHQNG
jgi:hypothetical protein